MISVCFQGKPFNIMVIQVYALSSNTEEAEVERFYEDLQDLLELTPKKRWSVRLTKLPKWHPVISLAPIFLKLRDHQIPDLWLCDHPFREFFIVSI